MQGKIVTVSDRHYDAVVFITVEVPFREWVKTDVVKGDIVDVTKAP